MTTKRTRRGQARTAAPAPAQPLSSPRWPAWLPVTAILIVGIACYANALHGPFVFDDRSSIEENLTIRHLGDLTMALHPPPQTPLSGRPIVNLTFAVNYALGGLAVDGYHLVNIGFHLLTALVLFGVLRRTFERVSPTLLPAAAHEGAALAASLLWMAHPLNTESVNYVSQRTELMLGLFFLLAVYAAIRALDQPRVWWTAVTAVSAVLAASCKESAIVLPIVLVLWDRTFAPGLPRSRGALQGPGKLRPARWPVYAAGAASWAAFALLSGQASSTRNVRLTGGSARWDYLLNQADVIPYYLLHSVWPRDLIFDYGRLTAHPFSALLPGIILLLVLLAVTVVALVRWPQAGFWGAWFWITLAPASSVVPIVTEVGAERRMYLPLIGLVCLITLGGVALIWRLAAVERRRLAGIAATATLVVALSAMTIARNEDYRTGLRLWQTVVDRRPVPRAHEHLSMFLRDAGRSDDSIAELRLTAAADPESGHALAAALLERGDLNEALVEFEKFVRTQPGDREIALARREYAAALRRAGRTDEAITQLRGAVVDEPADIRNYVELADALKGSGDTANAIRVLQDAERLDPRNVVVLSNLGELLAGSGAGADAIRHLRAALDIDAGLVAPRVLLVQQLLLTEDFATAEREARTLTMTAPNDATGYNLLGVALASQRRLDEAHDAFAKAVALDPTLRDAQQNLARIDAMRRDRR
jgi:Flp pilus assembly protein TadD